MPLAPCPARQHIEVSDSHVGASHAVCCSANEAVYVASPMLAPCIVTLADPVTARFVVSKTLAIDASIEYEPVTLPMRTPNVCDINRVPLIEPLVRHRIDVSDFHVVLSHAVWPIASDEVYLAKPMLAPCTVTLVDPVEARFDRRVTLSIAASTESTSVKLPRRCPVVTETRKVPFTIWLAWHRVDVSDSHVVRSHAVWPIHIDDVYVVEPILAPCTVTLADPVAGRFVCLAALSEAKSTENTLVRLPTSNPVVNDVRKVPCTIWLAWHRIDVSDSQLVRSHPVENNCNAPVYSASPMLAPCKVTLADPVAARFVCLATLSLAESAEYTSVKLPTRNPAVSDVRKVPCTIWLAWHRVDVSDSHVVRSHAEWPILIDPVYVASPKLEPCTVTLADPVAARFETLVTLSVARSTESPSVTLPA